ncbi:hypothetical protein [Streptomyces sp. NPDC001070]
MVAWLHSGPRAGGGAAVPGRSRLLGAVPGAVFGAAPGTAVAAGVLVHLLDRWLGVPVAVAAADCWTYDAEPARRTASSGCSRSSSPHRAQG